MNFQNFRKSKSSTPLHHVQNFFLRMAMILKELILIIWKLTKNLPMAKEAFLYYMLFLTQLHWVLKKQKHMQSYGILFRKFKSVPLPLWSTTDRKQDLKMSKNMMNWVFCFQFINLKTICCIILNVLTELYFHVVKICLKIHHVQYLKVLSVNILANISPSGNASIISMADANHDADVTSDIIPRL